MFLSSFRYPLASQTKFSLGSSLSVPSQSDFSASNLKSSQVLFFSCLDSACLCRLRLDSTASNSNPPLQNKTKQNSGLDELKDHFLFMSKSRGGQSSIGMMSLLHKANYPLFFYSGSSSFMASTPNAILSLNTAITSVLQPPGRRKG